MDGNAKNDNISHFASFQACFIHAALLDANISQVSTIWFSFESHRAVD